MKTAGIVAIALSSALFGAAITGWLGHTGEAHALQSDVLTNAGYTGPASVPLGDVAGGAVAQGALDMHNPLGDDPATIQAGKTLYVAMNCAGCHGYTGGGGMGPPLNDDYWRYGGAPAEIYKSLYEGRPKGMPAWGHALPPDELWQLSAYIHSLGGGIDPANARAARLGDETSSQSSRRGAGDTGK